MKQPEPVTAAPRAQSERIGASSTVIESLGVYLPKREVTTRDVLKDCTHRPLIPLERVTGIRSRRMAGETEFSIDLAKQAVSRCLATSKYGPDEIDLVICANISRQDSALYYSLEPAHAATIRDHFGMHRAMAFDVSNACAGMFTAIQVVDRMIHAGQIRRALVISGEYITHLTKTAQRELRGAKDPRLACLTLGDSGVCLLLERGERGSGFRFLEVYSAPEFSELCIAEGAESGGAIMYTDSVGLAKAAMEDGVVHFDEMFQRGKTAVDEFDYIIVHQTSSSAIKETIRRVNRHFGRPVLNTTNVIDNLQHRANTSSTTHWVALKDKIDSDTIKPGTKICFSVSASGLTVGTAFYDVDDLPLRMRNGHVKRSAEAPLEPAAYHRTVAIGERLAVAGIGSCIEAPELGHNSMELAARAGSAAYDADPHGPRHLGQLIFTGHYKKNFLSEPAMATLVAREMGIKGSSIADGARRLLAFDVLNGPPGVLSSAFVTGPMLLSSPAEVALIIAAEHGNLPLAPESDPFALAHAGSALLLERSSGERGFRSFYFDSYPQYKALFHAYAKTAPGGYPTLAVQQEPELTERYIETLAASVGRMLAEEGLSFGDFATIVPPQVSAEFRAELANALGVSLDLLADSGVADLHTSSLAFGLRAAQEQHDPPAGSLGLLLAVGPGLEVACATYTF